MQIQKRQLINIEGTELTRILYKDMSVLTLHMIDKVHGRPEGTASRNFYKNIGRFQEGKHFFKAPYVEWAKAQETECPREQRNTCSASSIGFRGFNEGFIILLTERGYLMLVKTFRDDVSWDVQDMLVEKYFQPQGGVILTERDLLNIKKNFRKSIEEDVRDGIKDGIKRGIKEGIKKGLSQLPPTKNVITPSTPKSYGKGTITIEDWPDAGGKILKVQVHRNPFGEAVNTKIRWDLMN